MAGKQDLVEKLASITGSTQDAARTHLDALEVALLDLLGEDDKVTVPGFFTAATVYSPPRKGRNPSTGEALDIPEKYTLKITVSPKIKNYFQPTNEAS